MPFFKVEFKRYHFLKTAFGEDLNYRPRLSGADFAEFFARSAPFFVSGFVKCLCLGGCAYFAIAKKDMTKKFGRLVAASSRLQNATILHRDYESTFPILLMTFMANRVAPAFRFCLSNSTLTQAIPIRYSFFCLSHIIVAPTQSAAEFLLNPLQR